MYNSKSNDNTEFELTPELLVQLDKWVREFQNFLSKPLDIPTKYMHKASLVVPQPTKLAKLPSVILESIQLNDEWAPYRGELNAVINLTTKVCAIGPLHELIHYISYLIPTSGIAGYPRQLDRAERATFDSKCKELIFAVDQALHPKSSLWNNSGLSKSDPRVKFALESNLIGRVLKSILLPILGDSDKKEWKSYKNTMRDYEKSLVVEAYEHWDDDDSPVQQDSDVTGFPKQNLQEEIDISQKVQERSDKYMDEWKTRTELPQTMIDNSSTDVINHFDEFTISDWITLVEALMAFEKLEVMARLMAETIYCSNLDNSRSHSFEDKLVSAPVSPVADKSTTVNAPIRRTHIRTQSIPIPIMIQNPSSRRISIAMPSPVAFGTRELVIQDFVFKFPSWALHIEDMPHMGRTLNTAAKTLSQPPNKKPFSHTSAYILWSLYDTTASTASLIRQDGSALPAGWNIKSKV